jgi:DNA-binding NarL/FixJ family response regulator
VGASLDQLHLTRQLQDFAASEERIWVARDLHDGVLQSLTGIRLELRAVAASLNGEESAAREAAAKTVTSRELEIVRMIGQGLRNKAIAERLCISEGTVKIHLHNVYEKLGFTGRLGLVLYAKQ